MDGEHKTPVESRTEDREIISFGAIVEEVGGEATHEVVLDCCGDRIRISGISKATAKEFALHLFETVHFSIKVKS
jgi:hypothetical protein